MVVRRGKKVRKFRGKRNYGYGSHKKHRGHGSRGGRGLAGMHKQKWSYTVSKDPFHFGKRGFVRPAAVAKKAKAINLRELQLEAFATGKKKLDLSKLGYDKVLSSGRLSVALEVVAKSFSKKAIEKIEAAGGKAVVEGKAVAEKPKTLEKPAVIEKLAVEETKEEGKEVEKPKKVKKKTLKTKKKED